MSALGHYFEDEGLATTGISLVREHTAAMRPPRFLWVPFPLGRPFGVANDPAFQHKVLAAALALLDRTDGPCVLADFPEDAPADPQGDDDGGWVCPVSFPAPPVDPDDLPAALDRELAELAPWYDLSLETKGRSTVGASGLTIVDAARFATDYLEGREPEPYRDGLSRAECLKLTCEDLKAFYQEAATAQPGRNDPFAVTDWIWSDTAAGRVLVGIHARLLASGDPELERLATQSFLPRRQKARLA